MNGESEGKIFNLFIVLIIVNFLFIIALKTYPSYLYAGLWSFLWEGEYGETLFSIVLLFLPLLFYRFNSDKVFSLRYTYTITLFIALLVSVVPLFNVRIYLLALLIGFYPLFLISLIDKLRGYINSVSLAWFLAISFATSFMLELATRTIFLTDYVIFYQRFMVAVALLIVVGNSIIEDINKNNERESKENREQIVNMREFLLTWFALSLLFFLLLNVFTNPNTILRYSLLDYETSAYTFYSYTVALALTVIVLIIASYVEKELTTWKLYTIVLFLVAFAVLTVAVNDMSAIMWNLFALVFSTLLLGLALQRLTWNKKRIVIGFTVFNTVYLIFSVLNALTFVYAYIPGAGFLRDASRPLFALTAVFIGGSLIVAWMHGKTLNIKPIFRNKENKYRLLALVMLVMVTVSFVPGYYNSIKPIQNNSTTITVMTYNIHQGFTMNNQIELDKLVKTIKSEEPDIIGLQEVDTGRITSAYRDQLLYLSENLNMHSYFAPALGNAYGVAALTKYNAIGKHYYKLPSQLEQRVLLHLKIDIGYTTINFFTVHLGLTTQERLNQLQEVMKIINNTEGPIILTGDFNAEPDTQEINMVKKTLMDAREIAETTTGSAETWPSNNPEIRIDYIFISKHFAVKNYKTVRTLSSDHLPVIAKLQLKANYKIYGSMYVNDAGEPKGGFEWAAEYNLTMHFITNRTGYIFIILRVGLGDPLATHTYTFTNLTKTPKKLTFLIKPIWSNKWNNLTLQYVETDEVWNKYNNYYIIRYADPTIFPGLKQHYYLEIRIPNW